MYYLIDGYNFLFSLFDSKRSLASQRQKTILFIKKQFSLLNLSGSLIFDGARRREEESGLSYPSPLEVVYTPKGQTADEYILEKIDTGKKKRQFTVVTNDRGLIGNCRPLGAKIISNMDFLKWLQEKAKKKKTVEKISIVETKYNIDRLLKVFEEKLKNEED